MRSGGVRTGHKSRRIESPSVAVDQFPVANESHNQAETRPKSGRMESQAVKTGSVAVDQFPVAKESQNQAETNFRFDFHFDRLNTEDGMKSQPPLSKWPINVKSCRTKVRHVNSFIVRNGFRNTALYQNDPTQKKASFRRRIRQMLSRNLQWSPSGSYLLAIINRTIIIYGGDGSLGFLPPIMRYKFDAMVEQVDFSPGEKYLVGYSRPEPSNTQELWLKIFDVRTGRLVTGLDGHVADDWPVIRWAGGKEDKYFATLCKNNVYVYETETFKPVDSDDDVVDISWSPTESILALWKRTKIVLVRIPEKKKLIQKDITFSSDCKMYWQSNGKYLAVKVNSVFELFWFKEDGIITTESLEVDGKSIAFAWEPNGHRFAVIHGEDQSKPRVSFYSMETGKFSKLSTFGDKQADTLFWSPRGKRIVLADLNGGHLEFFDVDTLQTTNKASHTMVNVVAWDPTGRYVATAVTIDEQTCVYSDPEIDGFKMWSLHGVLLYSVPSEDYRLLQVEWRPYGGIIDNDGMPVEEDSEEYSASDEEYSEAEKDRDYIWEDLLGINYSRIHSWDYLRSLCYSLR